MTRPKLPTLPIDQADRRVVVIGLVIVLMFFLACVAIGGGLGAGVWAFRLMSGMGG